MVAAGMVVAPPPAEQTLSHDLRWREDTKSLARRPVSKITIGTRPQVESISAGTSVAIGAVLGSASIAMARRLPMGKRRLLRNARRSRIPRQQRAQSSNAEAQLQLLEDKILVSPVQDATKGSEDVSPTSSPEESTLSSQALVIVVLCFLVTVICALDRAAMSVAILPMSAEFHYSDSDKGTVSAAYFWGYVVSNLAGGALGTSVSPKLLLTICVAFWSVFTLLTPLSAAMSVQALLACRALMGFCEGSCLPTMQAVLLNWVPKGERSRALSLVLSGITAGTVGSLFLAPTLVNTINWQSVFYVFGATGFVWLVPWLLMAEDKPSTPKDCFPYECSIEDMVDDSEGTASPESAPIPWAEIVQSRQLQGVTAVGMAHNVGQILMLSWLPTYFETMYKLDVSNASAISAPPWICYFIVGNLCGVAADKLTADGMDLGNVRKGFQAVASLGPALALLRIAAGPSSADEASFWFCVAMGSAGCSLAGFNATATDMARTLAPLMYGTFNAIGCLAGSLAVYVAGFALEASSPAAGFQQIFLAATVLYGLGLAVFLGTWRGEREFA